MTDNRQTPVKKKRSSRKKTQTRLGHDPLAWIDDGSNQATPDSGEISSEEIAAYGGEVEQDAAQVETAAEVVPQEITTETNTLVLPAGFNIAEVASVHQQALAVLASDNDQVTINASAVEIIDAASLQLLLVICRTASESNKKIQWQGVPDRMKNGASVLNISSQLFAG